MPSLKDRFDELIERIRHGRDLNHASFEPIYYLVFPPEELIDVMEKETKKKLACLNADGGATKNSFLMQFQADILDKKVVVSDVEETTALGAAFLAWLAVGYWKDRHELMALDIKCREFMPKMDNKARERLLKGWKGYIGKLVK